MIFFDIETTSVIDLTKTGADAYARHPSTRLLSAVWYDSDDNRIYVWHDSPYPISLLLPEGFGHGAFAIQPIADPKCLPPELLTEEWVAHNALGFDSLCWKYEQPKGWIDSVYMARAAGLPGKLQDLGMRLFGIGKDDGSAAMRILSTAKLTGGQVVYPQGTRSLWESLVRYNIADVLLLAKCYEQIKEFGEKDVIAMDCEINRRGIRFDTKLLLAIRDSWHYAERAAIEDISLLSGGELDAKAISSHIKMKKWLERQGIVLNENSLGKSSVAMFLDHPDDYISGEIEDDVLTKVKSILAKRSVVISNTQGKINTLLEIASETPDCRLRNSLAYYAAHTGRWGGRGLQPHNLARGDADFDIQSCLDEFQGTGVISYDRIKYNPSLALSTLFRPILIPGEGYTFGIADYNAIEARCVAWMAREEKLLSDFRNNIDPYCNFASTIFGRKITKLDKDERQFGKECILGLGYSMGKDKLKLTCDSKGIKYDDHASAVKTYRDTYRNIRQLWYDFGTTAINVVAGTASETICGRCRFRRTPEGLRAYLPSGRPLVYRDARVMKIVPRWARLRGLDIEPVDTVVYTNNRGMNVEMYGGKWAENISQAICRDLLATALVRLNTDAFRPVMHIHDEIICELADPEFLFPMVNRMSDPPKWADGFPIKVEGHTGYRYTKKPLRGAIEV